MAQANTAAPGAHSRSAQGEGWVRLFASLRWRETVTSDSDRNEHQHGPAESPIGQTGRLQVPIRQRFDTRNWRIDAVVLHLVADHAARLAVVHP